MIRANCCGKFRKDNEVFSCEESDSDGWLKETWFECKYCCSEFDRERYFKDPTPQDNQEDKE